MEQTTFKPLKIERNKDEGLYITWELGKPAKLITSEMLRRACPCANCREERGDKSHSTPLTPKRSMLTVVSHTRNEQLELSEIWGVGNYALGVRWGDGHDDGIYTFNLLAELSDRS
ncbi:MAG: DUF971 domain-containing protein [Bdellovibrionales bacterium]|nr:DUF971 domain-containing protein [Bdellovibrionales bacterium]